MDRFISYHLVVLKRGFDSGDLNEDIIENADETHFVCNLYNGKTLAIFGDHEVLYADVVRGGPPIPMA